MTQTFAQAVQSNDVAAARQLIESDPSILNTRDEQGNTPILTALYHGSNDVANLLIESGADLNVFEAAAAGRTERVQAAMDADPGLINSYSHDGWTPLHLAAFFGQAGTAGLLISRGADLTAVSKNRMENTPIHAASASGRTEVVELLLDSGDDPNRVSRGWTPLHLAAANGNAELVRLLLQRGADTTIQRSDGNTALEAAQAEDHFEVVALLREHGRLGSTR